MKRLADGWRSVPQKDAQRAAGRVAESWQARSEGKRAQVAHPKQITPWQSEELSESGDVGNERVHLSVGC